MNDLNRWSAVELVLLHNALCQIEQRITKPWKRTKRELIAIIKALGDHKLGDASITVAERSETIGAFIKAMLSTGASYSDIARLARARFQGARTTARSVASMASDRPITR